MGPLAPSGTRPRTNTPEHLPASVAPQDRRCRLLAWVLTNFGDSITPPPSVLPGVAQRPVWPRNCFGCTWLMQKCMWHRFARNSTLVAEHGSWNRSSPIGYQVTRLYYEAAKLSTYA